MKYIVPADLSLIDTLVHFFPQSSKNTLRSWIKEGRVQVDEVIAKNASLIVSKNQSIAISQRKKIIGSGITVLFEDKDMVVIFKPAGLLSVATAFEKGQTAHALLKLHYKPHQIYVVHRLDQDTSGVMVFALSFAMQEKLKKLFEMHDIDRAYTAIVEGQFPLSKGTWQSYQYEDALYHVHETTDETQGRLAITHYNKIASSKRYTWLELKLETGRKNQIRVHCEAAGYPVVGDKKYGAQTSPIKRLCLHAHLLSFQHPFTRKILRFESPAPAEFQRLVPFTHD